MGGHGGLNILPQKKWNVYNWDNRIKVEKDVRQAKELEEKNQQQRQNSGAQARIDLIKYNNKELIKKRSKEKRQQKQQSRSSSQTSDKPIQSKLNIELKELNKNKHLNFFEEEEDLITRQLTTKALMEKEQEFFKDKPYDSTSKFMGSLASEKNKPWYMKSRQENDEQKKNSKDLKNQINNFKQQDDNFYKVLKVADKIQTKKPWQSEIEKQNNQINNKTIKVDGKQSKKQQKIQKLARKLKDLLGSDDESSISQFDQDLKNKLRQERLEREKIEREKEQKLINQYFPFDFQRK